MAITEQEALSEALRRIKAGDIDGAIDYCEAPAHSQMPGCQRLLGGQYQKKGDYKKAIQWFSKAVAQGDNEGLSCFCLASAYYWNRDYPDALSYFRRAADAGNARGLYWQGRMHERGLGVERNLETAISFYARSGAAGNLLGERDWLRLAIARKQGIRKLVLLPRVISYFFRGVLIAQRDPNDPRLIDLKTDLKYRRRRSAVPKD